MGTSCTWLVYMQHYIMAFMKNCCLLTSVYCTWLPFYSRFIDDVIGIWKPPNQASLNTCQEGWIEFQRMMNTFGTLTWAVSKLSDSVEFLDLNIQIDPITPKITKYNFRKPMNLHLYIPLKSVHTNDCFKGMIYGILSHYWQRNSNPQDYQHMTQLFLSRLILRIQL